MHRGTRVKRPRRCAGCPARPPWQRPMWLWSNATLFRHGLPVARVIIGDREFEFIARCGDRFSEPLSWSRAIEAAEKMAGRIRN